MSDRSQGDDPAEKAEPTPGSVPIPSAVARRRHFSPVWLAPLTALGVVLYLGYHALVSSGPTIELTFETADGLKVEQTQVKYKAVTLGTVRSIELAEGEAHVVVKVSMKARAADLLTDRARFWVVRPQLQTGALAALQSSLETLVSGSYIELDPGLERGAPSRSFQGLAQPPAVRSGAPGTTFELAASELGSIGAGSSILHKEAQVGEVLSYELDERTGDVSIRAFVRAPYDRLVQKSTCFWNASGIAVGMGAGGLRVELASMRTMISGGIAFETPTANDPGKPVQTGHRFPLFRSEAAAEVALFGEAVPYAVYFEDSIQGLSQGSPVKLFGMQVGNVTDLSVVFAPSSAGQQRLTARVYFVLQPHRALAGEAAKTLYKEAMREQVARGLQVLLETSSYLTGEKALALSYLGQGKGRAPSEEAGVMVLPGQVSGIGAFTDTLSEVAARLNSIPYEQIGRSLNHTLSSIDHAVSGPRLERAMSELASTLEEVHALAREARAGLSPAFERLPQIAAHVDEAVKNASAVLTNVGGAEGDFQRKAQRLLTQVADMARSVRLLADYLERHPEALLRGRTPEQP